MLLAKIRPYLRVQAYLTSVLAVLLAAKLGFAYRSADQTFREVGGQIADYLTARVDGAESVSVNGERFAFATMTTEQSVEQVLAATEQACAANSGNVESELGPLLEGARKTEARLGLIEPRKLTTLRRDSSAGRPNGDVTCLTRPAADAEHAPERGFLARIERLADTWQLGELGEAHYLRAERDQDSGKTRILYVRSLGSLKLTNLFPEGTGDAPGRDPGDIPRPPGAVRTLSAAIDRTSDGFFSYESPAAPLTVLGFYDRELARSWQKMQLNGSEPETLLSRAYARGNRAVYVVAEPRSGGGSDVGLILLSRAEPREDSTQNRGSHGQIGE
jgi:hypothetical protein